MEANYLLVRRYDGSSKQSETRRWISPNSDIELDGWRLRVDAGQDDGLWRFRATVLERGAGEIAVGIGQRLRNAEDVHLAIPAAAYGGNRFRALPLEYPCILRHEADLRPDLETTISWVPRLPKLQLLAGDAAVPAIGAMSPDGGVWWFTHQRTTWGETGIEAVEDGESLEISLLYPGVREESVYNGSPNWRPSPDRGFAPSVGDTLEFEILEITTKDRSLRALYECFFEHRRDLFEVTSHCALPFSAAFHLIEKKHNDLYWNESEGYYMLSDGSWEYGQWQAGWVGGGIQMFGLAISEDEATRVRVRRMLDFVSGPAQSDSGLYWSLYTNGQPSTDMIGMEWGHDWHLIRRTGDVLYFLLKTVDVLEQRGESVESRWLESARRASDALLNIWHRNERFGMFVSQNSLEIRSGDTASGAIIPAALTLASKRFNEGRYLQVACESAAYFVCNYLDKGYTNGGPGEAAQCPDSESAFALLESLTSLYEATQDLPWLRHAESAAHLASSWVMPYDFVFPENSTFGALGMKTTGSVWANVQNKHSAPGICTLSGVSLLRLYRWTGNPDYLYLLRDIAHGVTQYLSREDRPVFDLPPGASCERVNTSDWEAPKTGPGEGFSIDCWSSISALLTCAEVPGVYVEADTGFVCVLDHIELIHASETSTGLLLEFKNPTAFEANVRMHVGPDMRAAHELPVLVVPAGGTATFSLDRP